MKPSYQDFKNILEEIFGQNLTDKADLAAKDFWENWSEILSKFNQN